MSDAKPVLYELDEDNEAVAVQYFCSEYCRRTYETDIPVDAGYDAEWPNGTQCVECGNPLRDGHQTPKMGLWEALDTVLDLAAQNIIPESDNPDIHAIQSKAWDIVANHRNSL